MTYVGNIYKYYIAYKLTVSKTRPAKKVTRHPALTTEAYGARLEWSEARVPSAFRGIGQCGGFELDN